MKKYVWKPWQGNLDSPNPTSQQKKPSEKSEPKEPKKPKDVDRMDKQELSYAMEWEHPIRTLSIGTLNANLKRALSTSPDLRNTVKSCIQEVVRQASITKRTCQRGIALYIEHLSSSEIDEKDRVILDMLCTRVSDKVVTSTEDLGAAKGTQGEGDEGPYITVGLPAQKEWAVMFARSLRKQRIFFQLWPAEAKSNKEGSIQGLVF
ncbi:hypothetical protein BGX31_003492 [Mortierella sp. GBA43]|nr:hypothetical protein BGX31_003492 [Mortierella sp. GBA43]